VSCPHLAPRGAAGERSTVRRGLDLGVEAQPCAGSKVKAPTLPGSVRTRRPAVTPSAWFLDSSTIVNSPPAALSMRQSAPGPAPLGGATVPSAPAA
jgi:hypothetical protein